MFVVRTICSKAVPYDYWTALEKSVGGGGATTICHGTHNPGPSLDRGQPIKEETVKKKGSRFKSLVTLLKLVGPLQLNPPMADC